MFVYSIKEQGVTAMGISETRTFVRKPSPNKTEIRKRMEELNMLEGFDVSGEEIEKQKRRALVVGRALNPSGMYFSVRWVEEGKSFRVIRTR
jgi:hypothetical protein